MGRGPEGMRAADLHDLAEQHGDGGGETVEAMLGEQLHDLVRGGRPHLVGHRRSVSSAWSAPPEGTGGGTPLQADPNYRKDDALTRMTAW